MGKIVLAIVIIGVLFIPVILLAAFKSFVGKQNFEEREKKMDNYQRSKIRSSLSANTFAQLWSPNNSFGHGGDANGYHRHSDLGNSSKRATTNSNFKNKNTVPECFAILGFNSKPSEDKLKNRYRELVKKYHPDKPDGDSEFFEAVNEAYKTAKKYY